MKRPKQHTEPPTVDTPSRDHREGIHATICWDLFGNALIAAQLMLGDERAISVYLSRGTRELRHMLGADQAAVVMRGYADSMHEATKNDLPDEEPEK